MNWFHPQRTEERFVMIGDLYYRPNGVLRHFRVAQTDRTAQTAQIQFLGSPRLHTISLRTLNSIQLVPLGNSFKHTREALQLTPTAPHVSEWIVNN